MKNKSLHNIVAFLVLGCYFLALTPAHSLWHFWTEEKTHLCIDDSHSHDEQNTLDCSFCNAIVSGQNTHLQADFHFFDFSKKITFLTFENIYFQKNLHALFTNQHFSLRAPPIY